MPKPIFLTLAMGASLLSTVFAQDNHWDTVMRLKQGTTVSIRLSSSKGEKRSKPQLCRLLKVSPDELECGVISGDREWMQDFGREQINEIRLARIQNAFIGRGTLIGGAIGGILFMIPAWKEYGALGGGVYFLYGGAIGAAMGAQDSLK